MCGRRTFNLEVGGGLWRVVVVVVYKVVVFGRKRLDQSLIRRIPRCRIWGHRARAGWCAFQSWSFRGLSRLCVF
jgi:hypothetical protein